MPEYSLTRLTAPFAIRKRQRALLRMVRDARQVLRAAEELSSPDVVPLRERAAAVREEVWQGLADTGWTDEVIANAITVMEAAADTEQHGAPQGAGDAEALVRVDGSWPLFTVTSDDRPFCVVRAPDHLDALRLAEPLSATRIGGTDVELVAGGVLTLPQQTRLGVRAPTTDEASYFSRRAVEDAVDAVEVILL